ncbi:hypothetical protein ACP70R_008075 [Stipagrostis hirtigluma subsp. patula]
MVSMVMFFMDRRFPIIQHPLVTTSESHPLIATSSGDYLKSCLSKLKTSMSRAERVCERQEGDKRY